MSCQFRKLAFALCFVALMVSPGTQAAEIWYLLGKSAPGLQCRPVAQSYGSRTVGPSTAPRPIRTPEDVAQFFRSINATILPVPTPDSKQTAAFHVLISGHEIGFLRFFRDQRLCLSMMNTGP